MSHSFDEVLTRRVNDYSRRDTYGLRSDDGQMELLGRRVGPLNLGTQVDHLHTDFSMGALEGTERPNDIAIVGDAFFVIQTDAGERYTKAGHFFLNNEGFLIDGDGNFLLGNNGPINVGGLDFRIDSSGNVFTEAGQIDTLRIESFEDNTTLRRQGSNYFLATVPPQADTNPYTIAQGFLEMSNIDIGKEMVDMLAMYRTYETNQRMVTMMDEITGKAVNEIGRLR